MSRYTKEVRWRFLGDESKAMLYIPQARGVLGLLGDTFARNVSTGAITREVAPGVRVRARYADFQPIVTIDVRRLDEDTSEGDLPTFVCIPQTDAQPSGVDATYPEAVLAPIKDAASGQAYRSPWGVLYAESTIGAFDAAPPPKGLYLNRFPDGVHHFGNIDWRGKRGERLTWYGPPSRYWPDRRFPPVSAKPYVFCLGEILIHGPTVDAGEPILAGDVRGAAIWRSSGAVYVHVIHHTGDTATLVRYTLIEVPTLPGVQKAEVAGYEIVSSTTVTNSLAPWFFNASGDRAVHMDDEPHPYAIPSEDPYPLDSTVHRLAIAEGGGASWSTETAVYEGSPAFEHPDEPQPAALVAIDYDGDEEVAMRVVEASIKVQDAAERYPHAVFNLDDDDETPRYRVYVVVDVRGSKMLLSSTTFPTGGPVFAESILYADLREWMIYSVQMRWTDWGDPNHLIYRLYRNGDVLKSESFLGHTDIESYTPQQYRWCVDTDYQDTAAPRYVLTANLQNDVPIEPDYTSSFTFGCMSFMAFPFVYDDEWTDYPQNVITDALGVDHTGWCGVEGDRVACSFSRLQLPAEIAADGALDRPAFNYMSRVDSMPARLGVSPTDAAFYPGAPLGRSLF